MRIAALATGLLFAAACSRSAPPTPEAAYSRFLAHVAATRSGEGTALLEDFDAATRDALAQRAAAIAKATDGHLPADPLVQLLQGPPPVAPTAITVVEQTEDRATLAVRVDAGASGQVVMVRESGRWRVHLDLDALK